MSRLFDLVCERDRRRTWLQRAEFKQEAARGSLYVGSPETVARKIAATARTLGMFDMKYSAGGLSHEKLMRCISLYGSKIIPLVRELLNNQTSQAVPEGST
jgi:alkanesulfonate monooxygenase SsuD/methylene tetrahydromethanopterin reductase-like flavin-dependent oxidoreductase (luciferase family)